MYITSKFAPMVRRAYCSTHGDIMPKVDLSKEFVQRAQIDYMKALEKENNDRVSRVLKMRKKNRYMGIGLFALVICIYAYSMHAVKQESFLDDIEDA